VLSFICVIRNAIALCIVLAICLACRGPVPPPRYCGDAVPPEPVQAIALHVGGVARRAIVLTPSGYDGHSRVPVVVAFPFFGGSPKRFVRLTDLATASEARGALLVVPEGIGGSWNAGGCCGEAYKRGVDDVAFTAALLDEVSSRYCVQDHRVVVTGMSNGALMAHRVGCELADRIHAIAPVAGPLHLAHCSPSRPISVLQLHGTADTQMPYGGGMGSPPVPVAGDLQFSSIDRSMQRWQRALGCDSAPRWGYRRGAASCQRWNGCSGGARLELCTLEGGGHTWPGGSFPAALGPTSHDLSAGAYLLATLLGEPP
jgi:polyhydroxybutyrate depolymerase